MDETVRSSDARVEPSAESAALGRTQPGVPCSQHYRWAVLLSSTYMNGD